MFNWNQFRNLPNIKDLPESEARRKFFIYESDKLYENSIINYSFNNSSAGGGIVRNNSESLSDYIDDDYIDDDYV